MKRKIGLILSGAGANEVKTYSFVHERTIANASQDVTQAFQLSNALSPDLQYYRLSLTPSLLEHVHANIKTGHGSFALFETGLAHQKDQIDADSLPVEFSRLACVYAGKEAGLGAAFYQARRLLEHLLDRYGVNATVSFRPLSESDSNQATSYYAPDRAAAVYVGETCIGYLGEYAPRVAKAFKLPARCAGFELDLPALLSMAARPSYTPLSKFPHVSQDISLKVAPDTAFGVVFDTARDAFMAVQPAQTTASINTLAIYQPEEADTKTITLRLTIASYERTLTDAEVTGYLDAIATAAANKHHAERV